MKRKAVSQQLHIDESPKADIRVRSEPGRDSRLAGSALLSKYFRRYQNNALRGHSVALCIGGQVLPDNGAGYDCPHEPRCGWRGFLAQAFLFA